MSDERLEDFIKKVHTDDSFKQSFEANPKKAMRKFGLSKRAQSAIMSIGVAAIIGAASVAQVLPQIDPRSNWM